MKPEKFKTIFIAAVILTLAQTATADSVGDSVRQGNTLYENGSFNDAMKEYERAVIDQPQTPEPKFNKANCYFQLDDLARAIDTYNEVAAESKDMKLVEKARYNLGNCCFQRGTKQKDSDLQKALEDLQTSIVHWRSALEINPENEKAANNIEVARLTIKDIIDQINKQKEQQQQQAEKQKQLQEQLKELAEQQRALSEKTQQTNNDADKGKIDRQQADDSYEQQAQEQSQLEDKTQQTLDQMQQQDPNNPLPEQMQQAGSEIEQALDAQSDAEEKLKDSDGKTAKQSQDKAGEHLENALKALSQDDQQNQGQQEKQEQTQQSQDPNQSEQQQQEQQAEQKKSAASDTTAQEILDKEQKEKKQRQMLQRDGYQKVEKDW